MKKINDTYGHEYGDILIQNAAAILRTVWDRKCIYRIGGDEFVAFQVGQSTMPKLQRLYTILEQDYCSFIDKNYPESHSSVSIGCVIGNRKSDFQELYRVTDELMYDIKKHGKRGYKIIELI